RPEFALDDEKQLMSDLADQARTWRKEVEQLTIGNQGTNNPPPRAAFQN
ncbi:unnamed protein product, partial [marine sediment metagenome]